jgi:hypothetical protein
MFHWDCHRWKNRRPPQLRHGQRLHRRHRRLHRKGFRPRKKKDSAKTGPEKTGGVRGDRVRSAPTMSGPARGDRVEIVSRARLVIEGSKSPSVAIATSKTRASKKVATASGVVDAAAEVAGEVADEESVMNGAANEIASHKIAANANVRRLSVASGPEVIVVEVVVTGKSEVVTIARQNAARRSGNSSIPRPTRTSMSNHETLRRKVREQMHGRSGQRLLRRSHLRPSRRPSQVQV